MGSKTIFSLSFKGFRVCFKIKSKPQIKRKLTPSYFSGDDVKKGHT